MSVADCLVDRPSHGLGFQHDQKGQATSRGGARYFMCLLLAGSGVCPRVGREFDPSSGAAGRVIEGAEKSETELSSAPESGANEPKRRRTAV